jgi:uncharacterized protein YbaP (TraB family)
MRPKMTMGLLALLVPLWAFAESSVWRVTSDKGVVYLAGSIHVLRDADYPLPDEFETAYAEADVLVLETKLDEAGTAALSRLLASRGHYGDGETIKDHLSPAVYRRLAAYCASLRLPLASVERFRPWLLVMTLTMAKMQAEGFQADAGLEAHFSRRAAKDGKPIHGLETLEDQIDAMAVFDRDGDPLVANFLDEAESYVETMEAIVRAWRSGDVARLEALALREMRDEHPDLYRALLLERNRRWLQPIEQWTSSGRRVLVVVGAAHLVGEESVISLLQRRGHRIEKVESSKH